MIERVHSKDQRSTRLDAYLGGLPIRERTRGDGIDDDVHPFVLREEINGCLKDTRVSFDAADNRRVEI